MRVPQVNSSMNAILAVPLDPRLASAGACDVSQENADANALASHDGAGACAVPPLAPRPRVHVYDEHHDCADARALRFREYVCARAAQLGVAKARNPSDYLLLSIGWITGRPTSRPPEAHRQTAPAKNKHSCGLCRDDAGQAQKAQGSHRIRETQRHRWPAIG